MRTLLFGGSDKWFTVTLVQNSMDAAAVQVVQHGQSHNDTLQVSAEDLSRAGWQLLAAADLMRSSARIAASAGPGRRARG